MDESSRDDSLFQIEELVVRRSGRVVIDGMSLRLPAAGIVGVVGPNGAGKTTLIETLAGRLAYAAGSASFKGREIVDNLLWLRRNVSVASVPLGAALTLRGIDYLKLIGAAEGYAPLTLRQVKLIEILDMGEALARPVASYSHGMQKKLSLIASLNEDAKVYFYDEIFNGLDIVSMRNMQRFFKTLSSDKLIVICSHFLQILFGWSDEVILISDGVLRRRWDRTEMAKFENYEAFEKEAIRYYPQRVSIVEPES